MTAARRITVLALATLALALAVVPMAHAAGTSIGDAETLTGSASGTLTSAQQDDWYVVYPTSKSASVTITVKNTTPQVTNCSLEVVTVTSTDGTSSPGSGLGNTDLEATQTKEFDVSGADRYFVELRDNNCNPGSGQPPPSYSVQVTGGGGTALRGAEQDGAPADNFGDAGPPLTGHVDYRGSLASATADHWYVLDVTGEAPSVSVRVENTTSRHIPCNPLIVRLTDTFGNAVQSTDIGWDTAHEFTIGESGRYFVELRSNNCGSADEPVTYRLQVDPASDLTQPGSPGRLPLTGGVSQEAARGPLAGGVAYTDTLSDKSTHWFAVRVNGSGPAAVNVENTSKRTAPCDPLVVRITNQAGTPVGSADLSWDTGYTFATSTPGLYYIALDDNNCIPLEGKPPMDARITISPPSSVTPNPAYGLPQCTSFAVTAVQGRATPIQLRCTGLGPLTYNISTGPAHGTLSGFDPATGTVTYTPRSGYAGADSLIYTAGNPFGYLAQPAATVAITVALNGGTQKGGQGPGGTGTPKPKPKPKPKIKGKVGKGKVKGKKGVRKTPRRVINRKDKATFRVWLKSQWKELAPVCTSYEIFSEALNAVEIEAGWPGRIAKFITDKLVEMTLARCKAHLERLLVTYTTLKKDPPSRHYKTVALPAAVRGPKVPRCPRGLPGQTDALLALCDAVLAKEAAKDKALDRVTAIDAALATAINRGGSARKAHDAAAQRLQYVAVQALLADSGQAMADYARARRDLAAAIRALGVDQRLTGRVAKHPLSAFKALRHDRHTTKPIRQIASLLVAGAHGKAGALAPPKTYRAALGENPSTASIAGAVGSLDAVDLQTLVAGLRHGHSISASRARSLNASLGALAKASKAKRGAALGKVGAQLRATGGAAGTLLRAVTGLGT